MTKRLPFILPLAVAAFSFFLGITWGLPSRDSDRYLFGDRTPWTGAEIVKLTGGWGSADRASDHDANPLAGRDTVQVVNATDAQRAEIVQRFRLYTHQPDEMVTLRALSSMRPSDIGRNRWALDPKMYQYGGLWVYPVGALLKIGSMFGAIDLRGDVAYYLDHPEAFARFYVVMRAYSALWGLAGVVATMLIVHRLTRDTLATVAAGIAFAMLPVVMNMAHEAKPHLAGAVLLLWTILAAARYVERGTWRWAAAVGALWGAATGMVLLSLPGGIILLAMVALRQDDWVRRAHDFAIAVVVGLVVYGVSNPYVLLHALDPSSPLKSNVQNYGNFYSITDVWSGLRNGVDLIAEGTTTAVAVVGLVAAIATLLRAAPFSPPGRTGILACLSPRNLRWHWWGRHSCLPCRASGKQWELLGNGNRGGAARQTRMSAPPGHRIHVAVLLAAPAVVVTIQFVLLGAGKPGEYGRFAILPDVALLIACVVGLANLNWPAVARRVALVTVLLVVAVSGGRYLLNFVVEESRDTRAIAAETIGSLADSTGNRLAIVAEPAPYCTPPVDLFRWQLMLLPKGQLAPAPGAADVFVAAADVPQPPPPGYARVTTNAPASRWPARISWANKPIDLFVAEPNTTP